MRLAVMEVDADAPAEGQDPQQLPEAAVRARWGQGQQLPEAAVRACWGQGQRLPEAAVRACWGQGQRLPEAAVRAHWGQGQGPLGTVLSGYACGSKAARDALSC